LLTYHCKSPAMKAYPTLITALSCCCFVIFFYSCHKDGSGLTVINAPYTTITDTSIYINMNIDGKPLLGIENLQSATPDWGSIWPGETGSTGDSSIFVGNRIGAEFGSVSSGLFIFTKGNCVLPVFSSVTGVVFPSVTFIDTFFRVSSCNYSSMSHDTTYVSVSSGAGVQTKHLLNNGITISWIDNTGKLWASFNGSADQTGSYFRIENNDLPARLTFGNITTVTASFDCKLYDNNGNMMHLSNGRFRQPMYE
jgi:hypothetical protein